MQEFYWPHHAVPGFRRLMVFVDGENLVCRYQAMIDEGWKPVSGNTHIRDSVVWNRHFTMQSVTMDEVIKATYYTYTTGDEPKALHAEKTIKSLDFIAHRNSALPKTLMPKVFRKSKSTARGKGVDISMVVDVLTHVHNDHVDSILLMTGDGDFMPLVQEVQRSGKQ